MKRTLNLVDHKNIVKMAILSKEIYRLIHYQPKVQSHSSKKQKNEQIHVVEKKTPDNQSNPEQKE